MTGAISTERFIDLATSLDLAVMAVDAETLGVLGASDPAMRILRLDQRDILEVPTSWLSFMSADTLEEVRSFSREAQRNNTSPVRLSATGTFRDAQTIRMTFVKTGEFAPEGIVVVGLDPDSARQSANSAEDRFAEREIETSARIQQSLLAGSFALRNPAVSLAAESIPSLKVDGDFYDFWELEPGSVDFMIGDVMGKGIPAALTAAALKAAISKAIIKEVLAHGADLSPERILSEADAKISPGLLAIGRFLTLYYCRLSAAEGVLRFIDAGHTSFLFYDSQRRECWQGKGSNMPLGFARDQRFQSYTLPFHSDDVFLFYSDGITEAETSDGSQFSTERLMQFLTAHSDLSAEELVKKTLSMVFFFSAGGFRDDATVIAARITGQTPAAVVRFDEEIARTDSTFLERCRNRFMADCALARPDAYSPAAAELSVALIESLGNVIRHTTGRAWLDWEMSARRITVSIDFEGTEYDWFDTKEPAIEDYPEHGFGSWLISQSVDSAILLRGASNKNRIVMTREIA